MENFTDSTILFGLAILVAIIIERVLEILKSIYDMADSTFNFHHFWTRRAKALAEKLEGRLKVAEISHVHLIARILNAANKIILKSKDGESLKTPVVSGDLVRIFYLKIFSKIIGVILGVTITFFTRIDLLAIWEVMSQTPGTHATYAPQFFGLFLTGVLTGLGAGPLHKVIIGMEIVQKMKSKK